MIESCIQVLENDFNSICRPNVFHRPVIDKSSMDDVVYQCQYHDAPKHYWSPVECGKRHWHLSWEALKTLVLFS